MLFEELKIKGVYLISLAPHEDERGFFARSFCEKEFREAGLCSHFVQCNMSYNIKKGTLRGMHYQVYPNEEIKLVSCIRGAIFDVALDLRVNSPTRGQWLSVELTEKNHQMLYIPEGIAHGFQSLVDETMVYYQMSEFYHPEAARCVSYNDAKYNIIWPIAEKIISARDMMPYE